MTDSAKTMTVTVRDSAAEERLWGTSSYRVVTKKVTISLSCPRCGGPRGKPRGHNSYGDGQWYSVECWDNPCGHTDLYANVIKEANEMNKQTSKGKI